MDAAGKGEGRVARLLWRLASEDAAVRVHAALALSELGPEAPAALPGLVAALESGDPHTRRVAAWALGYVGPGGGATAALARALADADEGVRQEAAAALARRGPEARAG